MTKIFVFFFFFILFFFFFFVSFPLSSCFASPHFSSRNTWFWVDIPVYFCHEHDWAAMKTQSGVILTCSVHSKADGRFM